VALAEVQLSTVELPMVMLVGDADSVQVGEGGPPPAKMIWLGA
jgi:hypothetical protein